MGDFDEPENTVDIGKRAQAWRALMKSSMATKTYVDNCVPEKSEDELLREKHPGLQEAWERYQTILQLVKVV